MITAKPPTLRRRHILYVVNEAYFFMSHRLAVARAARDAQFEVHVAAPSDHVWAPSGFNSEEIVSEGFHFHSIPLTRRGKNPLQDFRTLWALCRLYHSLKPDIVHHMTIKPVIYGSVAARLVRIPARVNLVTGLGHVFVDRSFVSALLRRAVLVAYRVALTGSRVIFQNPENRDALVAAGVIDAASTLIVRGSGVALDLFRPAPELDGPITIILPARLIWEKGVAEYVEAARRMRSRQPPLRFVLVGDTKESNPRAIPEVQLRAWHDEGVIEWWGRCDDMPAVFAQSHIVCLPSTYGEGVPKVLIEAAAAGRPIVTTDIPGCREVVRSGENGLLIPPGDVDSLVSALDALVSDRQRRNAYGRRGRMIAEAEFSVEEVVRQTLEIYRELLSVRGPLAP